MEESYICPNCGTFGYSRDVICPQCGHRSARSGGGSKLPIFIGVGVVGIIAVVGVVFASGGFSGDSLPVAPVSSPIDPDIETTKTSEIPTAEVEIETDIFQLLSHSSPYPISCPECNLFQANLSGYNLFRADLSGANLTGAYLFRANLTGVNLTEADRAYANLADHVLFIRTKADLDALAAREGVRGCDAWALEGGALALHNMAAEIGDDLGALRNGLVVH